MNDNGGYWVFVAKDNQRSYKDNLCQTVNIDPDNLGKFIIHRQQHEWLIFLEFFNRQGQLIGTLGNAQHHKQPTERQETVHLEDGQRLVGFKSRSNPVVDHNRFHFAFNFVLMSNI